MSYLFLEEGVTIGGDGCGENGTLGKIESQVNCSNKKIGKCITNFNILNKYLY